MSWCLWNVLQDFSIVTYACILTIQNMNNEFEMSKVSKSGLVAINLTGFQRLSVYQKWSDFRLKRLNVSSNIYWRVVHLNQTLLGRLHFAFVLIVNRRHVLRPLLLFLLVSPWRVFFSQFKGKCKGFLVTQVKVMWKNINYSVFDIQWWI